VRHEEGAGAGVEERAGEAGERLGAQAVAGDGVAGGENRPVSLSCATSLAVSRPSSREVGWAGSVSASERATRCVRGGNGPPADLCSAAKPT
jgi:hypothetical protein